MNDNTYYTEQFANIMSCPRERSLVRQTLEAWENDGLPDDFGENNVRFAFNRNSGNVFLVNDDYDVAMLTDGKLESFYTMPYDGHEGFLDDLVGEADNTWHQDDLERLMDILESNDKQDTDGYAKVKALLDELTEGE